MLVGDVKSWPTIESASDVQHLLNDINRLSTWPIGALIRFNRDECTVLRLYPRQTKDSNVQYQLNKEILRCVSHQGELGIIVDETLKPHRQGAKAAKNANSIMTAIKASFIDITPALFHKIYGAFICPH